MMDSNKILKLLPNIDCSLCQNPACATLARKISRGTQNVTDCPLIRKDNQKRIEQLLTADTSDHSTNNLKATEYYDEEIIEIQPCAEYGRATLEAHLPRPENSVFDLFDSCEMCLSFNNITSLVNVKCSLEMGYGLAESEERRIHVFKTGKIMIRRAKDRTDAINTLKLISYSLGPSIICSCGNSLADCLSGGCDECTNEIGSGLKWLFKSHEFKSKKVGEVLQPIINEFGTQDINSQTEEVQPDSIDKSKGDENDLKILMRAWGSMKQVKKRFEELDKLITANKFEELEAQRDNIYNDLREISKSSNEYLISDLEHKPRTEALVFLGICRNLRRINDAYLSLKDTGKDADWLKSYPTISSLIFDGFSALESCDYELAADVEERFKKFNTQWQDELRENDFPMGMVNLYKLAINGYYMARTLRIPVPV